MSLFGLLTAAGDGGKLSLELTSLPILYCEQSYKRCIKIRSKVIPAAPSRKSESRRSKVIPAAPSHKSESRRNSQSKECQESYNQLV